MYLLVGTVDALVEQHVLILTLILIIVYLLVSTVERHVGSA